MDSEKQPLTIFDNLLFPKIFQTFRVAVQPSKLMIAFSAVVAIWLAGWAMDLSKTVVATSGSGGQPKVTELQIYIANPDRLEAYIEDYSMANRTHTGVFSTLWHFASERFHAAIKSLSEFNIPGVVANIAGYFKGLEWAFRYHTIYCIIFSVVKLAVIALAGGAICRIAALQFAQDEKPGLTEALRFSSKKFPSFFAAPLIPLGIIIFIGLFISVLGLIGNIPWVGELLMGVFAPLALIAGALIAVILIGVVAGFNLMFPAIAYEASDCFDAISRSFSYLYARPWRMGFYTTIAAAYGAICYTFVRFFAFLLLLVTNWFLQLGVFVDNSSAEASKLTAVWPEPNFMDLLGTPTLTAVNWSESIAAFLIHLSLLVVVGLVVSFVISFYFSANTIIYAFLRNKVDDIGLEEVHTGFQDVAIQQVASESESEESKPEPEPEAPPQ